MFFNNKITSSDEEWEFRWAPYDSSTYEAVLKQLAPDDVVLEIGAGDLRLARQMARITSRVYAIEINADVLDRGRKSESSLPKNLIPIRADARFVRFPPGISVGVLLMRHCTHFKLYAEKLKALGCNKMITNARWRMSVETIELRKPRTHFSQLEIGWYACWCGGTGFKSGPAEFLQPETEVIIHEVIDCPSCSEN
jgi:SAM-dependent methyltransferase